MKKNLTALVMMALLLGIVRFGVIRAQDSQTLTVFAASSLTDAFEEIGAAFEQEFPGVDVVFNFGSSSTLATQLVEGAPADVFASANATQMAVVSDAGLLSEAAVLFAKNRLVLAVPADNPANIHTLRDLATPGVRLVLAAPGVPVRQYTDTMLERMAASPRYGEGYRAAVLSNVVSEEDNVRQGTAKVLLGEADAAIVYLSDVQPENAEAITAIRIPTAFNSIAEYPIGILKDSANPEAAQAFVDLVVSDAGQAILVKWGFIRVESLAVQATPDAAPTQAS
jgi:molybdate transport system substrate-binding protein